ncbi:FAD-dependent oxidoreductase [Legionella fairfieldensis]|uniref:FAD-dependent oxidoreductase n=1 Tax=Legionella fairfieldensis TaxID=45064 RepID=UPI000490E53E|nr:NAD(P)/FAD-dependent oxidoreductase [Legionella fairfieldensis]
MKNMTIIGAGLAGTLLSLYMARRGYNVELFEARPDERMEQSDKGRSINLALSCRGITALAGINLMSKVEKIMVPMRARAIHQHNGEIKYQAFGRHKDEYINAILRSELNKLLLDEAEKNPRIQLHFNMKLVALDVYKETLQFEHEKGSLITKTYQLLVGADGANSYVREALANARIVSYSRQFLPHGYKELSISKSHSQTFRPEHLHLWPRDSFMLLGNPNRDNSITGTLFLPNEGKNSFAELTKEASIHSFFSAAFPDAYKAMPDLINEFMHHPRGNLSTVTCSPWYFADRCLLIGDAAHGIVPFFGQGMNSSFEDCRILNELLDQYNDDWKQVMPAFSVSRKINTDAVAEMSMDNYHEIQSNIQDSDFNLRKQVEQELMHRYPERYISKHVLVMFTNTPYVIAKEHGLLQSQLLNQICSKVRSMEAVNWDDVARLVDIYENKIAARYPALKR